MAAKEPSSLRFAAAMPAVTNGAEAQW